MDYRVLVVAGTGDTLRQIANQLQGADIQVAESANDVLWEVNANPPHAIVANASMPDMSGSDLAEILHGFGLPTRLILWSAQPDPALAARASELDTVVLEGELHADMLHAALQQAYARYATHAAHAAEAPAPEPEPEPESSRRRAPEPEPEPAPRTDKLGTSELSERTATRARLAARASEKAAEQPRRPSISERAAEKQQHSALPAEGFGRRNSGNMVVTAENLTPIRAAMSDLSQELGPQCILLTDRAGMVLVEVGTTDNLPTMILLPLLSTSFSTAGEIARQLKETETTTLYIHEGHNYDLYCFDISQRFLLTLVFNKAIANARIGAVWVNTRRAIRELQDILG